MKTERVAFANREGQNLAARIDRPLREQPRAWAVFAHCFTCSKNSRAAVAFSRALASFGWGVLRFDFTGLGDSDGEFEETHFSSNVRDLVDAANWLNREYGQVSLMVGHSLGGAAVLAAAQHVASVTAVATIGAPSTPEHALKHLGSKREVVERDGEASVVLGGRRFTIRRSLVEDLAAQPMVEYIAQLKRALLVLHAPHDEVVSVSNAAEIFQAAKHPKSFVSLDDADHLLTRQQDAQYAATVTAAWSERYLPPVVPDTTAPSLPREVSAWGPVPRRFATEISVAGHQLVADEPQALGGGDQGPTPYDLLLSALGACTVMTLRMYADRKQWPLEQAICHLSHEKIYAKDCASCADEKQSSPGRRLDHIVRRLELQGDLNETQRSRLLEIADKCPVHKSLEGGGAHIETALVSQAR